LSHQSLTVHIVIDTIQYTLTLPIEVESNLCQTWALLSNASKTFHFFLFLDNNAASNEVFHMPLHDMLHCDLPPSWKERKRDKVKMARFECSYLFTQWFVRRASVLDCWTINPYGLKHSSK
jgi:hypothetical protein